MTGKLTKFLTLLETLEQVLDYADRHTIAASGLAWSNLYCLLDAHRVVRRFYLRNFGWKGNPPADNLAAVRTILENSLRKKDSSLLAWQQEAIQQNSLKQMRDCFRQQQQEQEQAEDDDVLSYPDE